MENKVKKILILNYEFPPLGGGAGNATYYLLKEFSKQSDVEINLITSSVGIFRIEQFAPNIRIHFLDIGKKSNIHHQSVINLLTYSWKCYWYAKKLNTKNVFDVCHAFFGIPCGFIAMLLGIPYIVSLRGSDVPFYSKRFYILDTLFFKWLSIIIWSRAKAVVANSEGLKNLALQTAPSQEISVIVNGVDTEEFKPIPSKVRDEKLRLVSTGRLIERKGYTYLLQALKGLQNVELTLIGDGPLRSDLEREAKEYGVSVAFLGSVAHTEVVRCLQNRDVFVLPSLNEGMSNAILEAMACGLPVVATDTGGSKELISDNGFIIQKADSHSLREVVVHYISNPELVSLHGEQSRILAERMSWKEVLQEYKKLL